MSKTRKPKWLPKEMWPWLQKAQDPERIYDATDGFLVHCARHHPDYNEFARLPTSSGSSGLSAQQKNWLATKLGIKKRRLKAVDQKERDGR